MIILSFAIALAQVTAQQAPKQKTNESFLDQWIQDHQVELGQRIDRIRELRALTYDQARIVYDQCLARAAASLETVAPEDVFNRARVRCSPLRADLLNGKPAQWFLAFNTLDSAKRASFPALTKQTRERLRSQLVDQARGGTETKAAPSVRE
jgi:hypothetical protein